MASGLRQAQPPKPPVPELAEGAGAPTTLTRLVRFCVGSAPLEFLVLHPLFLIKEVEIELSNLESAEIAVGVYARREFDVVFHNRIN